LHWEIFDFKVDSTHYLFIYWNCLQFINLFVIISQTLIYHLKVIMRELIWCFQLIHIVIKNYGDISNKLNFSNLQQKYTFSDKINSLNGWYVPMSSWNKANTTDIVTFVIFPIFFVVIWLFEFKKVFENNVILMNCVLLFYYFIIISKLNYLLDSFKVFSVL